MLAGAVGSGRQVKARAANEDEVMATLTLPYTDPADARKMASIHSNPPGVATDYASVVYRRFGKGKVIWVAAPLEAAVQQPHKEAFAQMIRTLAAAPFSFEADAPPAVEVTLFHQPDKKRYLVNVVNEQELLPPVPVFDMRVQGEAGRQAGDAGGAAARRESPALRGQGRLRRDRRAQARHLPDAAAGVRVERGAPQGSSLWPATRDALWTLHLLPE